MDIFKNKMVQYGIGANETVQYFHSTVNSILLHYYLINVIVNGHVKDPGQSLILINDNFTVVSIIKSPFKE